MNNYLVIYYIKYASHLMSYTFLSLLYINIGYMPPAAAKILIFYQRLIYIGLVTWLYDTYLLLLPPSQRLLMY